MTNRNTYPTIEEIAVRCDLPFLLKETDLPNLADAIRTTLKHLRKGGPNAPRVDGMDLYSMMGALLFKAKYTVSRGQFRSWVKQNTGLSDYRISVHLNDFMQNVAPHRATVKSVRFEQETAGRTLH